MMAPLDDGTEHLWRLCQAISWQPTDGICRGIETLDFGLQIFYKGLFTKVFLS